MPGRSDLNDPVTEHEFDGLAALAAGGLSRRKLLARAAGLAAAALLPPWIPFARAKDRLGVPHAQTSTSTVGYCPPPSSSETCNGTELGPWSAECAKPVANGTRAQYNGCGPQKWKSAAAKALDHPLGASFTQTCNEHDCCYGACGANKAVCDKKALRGWVQACEDHLTEANSLPGKVLASLSLGYCYDLAYTYYSIVALGGRGPFSEAQAEVCSCCEGEKESGPCGGKTCREGELCCQGTTCYDPRCFACCNLASNPGDAVPIFLSPGSSSAADFCIGCGSRGGIHLLATPGQTCASVMEAYPGCECSGPYTGVAGNFEYCESRPG